MKTPGSVGSKPYRSKF